MTIMDILFIDKNLTPSVRSESLFIRFFYDDQNYDYPLVLFAISYKH